MKLLHFADLHLGVDNYGSMDAASGVSSRVNDVLRALDTIVDRAIEDRVDAVLFAGDAYKNRDPNATLQREFAKRIHRLARAEIPTVLLAGNHDLPAVHGRAAPTEIYDVLDIPFVYVCRFIEYLTVDTNSGPLQIVAVPWVNRSTFMAHESYKTLADQRLDEAITDVITTEVAHLSRRLDPEVPSVLLAHVSLDGAVFGLERSIMLGNDIRLARDDLKVSAFDYVALGHIHKHQVMRLNPPIIYAGSPERVDFGEESEDKGYILFDILTHDSGDRFVNWEFVTLPARSFVTLRVNAQGEKPMSMIEREISAESARLKDAIVRCFIKVDPGYEASVSPREIRHLLALQQPSHIATVSIESDSTSRPRIEVPQDEALDPVKMLDRWLGQRELEGAFRDLVRLKGHELISQQQESE